MYDLVIEVSADGITGTYSLAKYVYRVTESDETSALDKALVKAFYTYTAYANIYYGVMHNN
jgi:hypothetical protein